jgi:hypothetical protein
MSTSFEVDLVKALTSIAIGLESVATSIDNAPTIDAEITEAGNSIERGLADVAKSIDSLEVNR